MISSCIRTKHFLVKLTTKTPLINQHVHKIILDTAMHFWSSPRALSGCREIFHKVLCCFISCNVLQENAGSSNGPLKSRSMFDNYRPFVGKH